MFKKKHFIWGWISAFTYSAALLAIPIEKIASLFIVLHIGMTVILVGTIIVAAIWVHRSDSSYLPHAWGVVLATTAYFAVECAAPSQIVQGIPPLFLLVIFSVAYLGTPVTSGITVFVFVVIEPIKILIQLVFNRLPVSADTLISVISHDPWKYVVMIGCGIIASYVAASNRSRKMKPRTPAAPAMTKESLALSESTSDKGLPPPTTDTLITLRSDNSQQEIADLLSSVVYFMSKNFRSYSSLGFIYDPLRNVFTLNSFQSKSMNIRKNAVIPLNTGTIGKLGTERKPFMSGDIRVYNSELTYYEGEEPINSFLGVPIVSKNELLGALVLDSRESHAFKDQDKETLKRFSTLAAALITSERMRFFQEKTATISNMLYKASHQFTTALKTNDVFSVLFNVIPAMIECSRQISIELEEESNIGVVKSVCGAQGQDIASGDRFPVDSGGMYAYVFKKRAQLIIPDYQQYIDRYYRFVPNEPRRTDIRSLAIFPLTDNEQRCRGLYSIEADQPHVFTEDFERMLTILLENASVAFGRALLFQKMERLATIDGLTGLNNHRTFQEMLAQEVERSRRYNRPLSLLLMDIDHFKTFNDTYGHPVGDLVLKEIAGCIKRSIRINDIPARYGGEEFVVIVPETNERGALITAERIRAAIEMHTIISLDRQLKVSVSIGCSAYPENAPSQQALIDTADKALYAAKKGGRNRVVPFKNDR